MIKLNRPICPEPDRLAGNYKHPANKASLKDACNDKCMYCESKISHIDHAHVEHIKPKSKYPELKFKWTNLGYSCPKCNNAKGQKFSTQTPYLDPYAEDPSSHLFLSGSLYFPRNGSERAELTIRDIELNRPSLVERRYLLICQIDIALKACFRTENADIRAAAFKEIEREAEDRAEFSLCVKSHIEAHGRTTQ